MGLVTTFRAARRLLLVGAVTVLASSWSLAGAGDAVGGESGWSRVMERGTVEPSSDASSFLPVDGRIWWVRSSGGRWTLESRALTGGEVRRVRLGVEGLVPPGPPGGSTAGYPVRDVDGLRVGGGRLYVTGYWKTVPTGATDGTGQSTSPETLSAVFDVTTGALLRQERPLRTPRGVSPFGLVRGTPAVVADRRPVLGTLSGPLRDPWSQVPYGISASVVSGGLALQRMPDGRPGQPDGAPTSWSGQRGLLRVVELAGGRTRYQLGADAVRRATGAGPSVAVSTTPTSPLLPDGSLGITAERTRGSGLRAVGVDGRGTVRRLSGMLPHAKLTETVVGYRRAFVSVAGRRKLAGRWRDCGGLWITDLSGKRGRRLDLGAFTRAVGGSPAPVWWDGRHAVWAGSTDRQRTVVHVEDLRGVRLRRSDLPSCR